MYTYICIDKYIYMLNSCIRRSCAKCAARGFTNSKKRQLNMQPTNKPSSVLQLIATHCSILQFTTSQCNMLHQTASRCSARHCHALQHTAMHCNILHVRGTRGLQTSIGRQWEQCNTLQHTATHCNTLHHAASNCNTAQPL